MNLNKTMDILYTNIRSLKKNLDELNNFLVINKLSPIIIALTETWLGKNSFFNPNLNGYNYITCELDKRVGGVAFFIKNNIQFKIRTDYQVNVANCEELWIEVITNNTSTIYGLIYRHPNRSETLNFQQKFIDTIYELSKIKKTYFILGDFNYCLNNNAYDDYLNNLLNLGCTQLVEEPTHPNPVNDSLIDHIYSNCCDKELTINHMKEDITDHHILHLSITNLPVNMNSINSNIMKRSMKNFSADLFCLDLQTKFEKISNLIRIDNADVNDLFDQFVNGLTEVINKHCPLSKLSKKARKMTLKPWITRGILKSYRTKKKLYLIKSKSKSQTDISKYKKFSNLLNNVKDSAKTIYYQNLFMRSSHDMKKTWKNINDVIRYKKPTNNHIDSIRDDKNSLISDNKQICNVINDYFINIGRNLGNTLSSHSDETYLYAPPYPISSSFFLKPMANHEVLALINKLKLNKSTGPNHTPHKFIKIGKHVISPILTSLINLSFQSGVFPKCLKHSDVIPIYKSGDKQAPNNYRPISLTSPFAKILERCICTQLNSFFDKNKLIHPDQFGFQKNTSTEMAISKVYQTLSENIDNKLNTCAIFLDIRKAFDSVNHQILISKLSNMGVRGIPLTLLESFLTNRSQSVTLNNATSTSRSTICGVPQGSVLGPLFFLCYINDLPQVTSFHTTLFADDACLI